MSTYKISHNVKCTVNEKGEAVMYCTAGLFGYLPDKKLSDILPADDIKSIKFVGIRHIGSENFCGFSNLHTVELSEESIVRYEAFKNCKNLQIVKGLETAKEIGPGAFQQTSLAGTINLENNPIIHLNAFALTKIESVKLNYPTLYEDSFAFTPLKSVAIIDSAFIPGFNRDPFRGSKPDITVIHPQEPDASSHEFYKRFLEDTLKHLKQYGHNVEEIFEQAPHTEERPSLSEQIESVQAEPLADSNGDKAVGNDTQALNQTENHDTFDDGDR